jgi:acyl-coenzyme A synthetase/AMP-(fatty) acid ligase
MADKGTSPPEVNIESSLQEDRKVERPSQFAESLKKGNRVALYMGITSELPIAMLARVRASQIQKCEG